MTDPKVREGRIRRLYGLTLIAEADLAELLGVHGELVDVCMLLYGALERIARLSPRTRTNEAIRIAREALRQADSFARPR